MTNILNDLLIVDASTVLAGPSVGTFFAELGARVIKVEHPSFGDVTRTWKTAKEDSDSSISAYFSSVNYKKEYKRWDLSNPEDNTAFKELVATADILLTNFKRGDDRKFGIEDGVLRQENPSLIIGKINGYGEESDRVAYDLILQAESGFMSMNGTPESGPVKMPVALIDVLAAHHLKEALLLALLDRTKSNRGVSVSVSLYDAAVSSLVNQASNYLMSQLVPQRIGSLHPNIAPYGELFETKDGATITFAIGSNAHFEKLCRILKLDDLLLNRAFSENQGRVAHRTELAQAISAACIIRTSAEILAQMEEANVPAGKITPLDEVFDAQKAQRLIREEVIDGVSTKRITSTVFTWK